MEDDFASTFNSQMAPASPHAFPNHKPVDSLALLEPVAFDQETALMPTKVPAGSIQSPVSLCLCHLLRAQIISQFIRMFISTLLSRGFTRMGILNGLTRLVPKGSCFHRITLMAQNCVMVIFFFIRLQWCLRFRSGLGFRVAQGRCFLGGNLSFPWSPSDTLMEFLMWFRYHPRINRPGFWKFRQQANIKRNRGWENSGHSFDSRARIHYVLNFTRWLVGRDNMAWIFSLVFK